MRREPSEEHDPPHLLKLDVLQTLVCTDRLVDAGKVAAEKVSSPMTNVSSPRPPSLAQLFRERS
jgi:hypothetical protein